MPSSTHEALVDMFRQRVTLAGELLEHALGLDLPAHQQVRLEAGEFTDLIPTEYRADAVVVLMAAQPVLGVVVEVQLSRDPGKRWSWPVYLATLRARLRCPTVLLVVCMDAPTAAWCAAPIELGPGAVVAPFVLGPDRVPVVEDSDVAARAPELAVLSAMLHGAARRTTLDVLSSALGAVDDELADRYYDLVLAALPTAAQRYLEELMATRAYEYQSDFARRYFSQGREEGEADGKAEGKAEGESRAVLAVLDARGIDVPTDARARITDCSDLDQLDTWVRRAATAGTIGDLFDQRP